MYDDGAGWPNTTAAKERAFRQGFTEEARRAVREWTSGDLDLFDPFGQEEEAQKLRLRTRERYTIYRTEYGPGCAGRKTHHVGYRPGHDVPAARLRGRHHALAYITQTSKNIEDREDSDTFNYQTLPAWLAAVERWAAKPIKKNALSAPPPRPLNIMRANGDDGTDRKPASDCDSPSPSVTPPPTATAPALSAPPTVPVAPATSTVRPLALTRADAIEMRKPDWLLRGMLERDTFALVFGDPGCGKSFLAIDWACRIATGTAWRGHDVKPAPVVYVAGEGQQGFGRRIRAWGTHNGVSLADAPLYVAPAVAIPDVSHLVSLVAAIQSLPKPPAVIVLDTLARCFGGGDENSTQDMSKFVAACDALRRHYGCTILVVHHTGHAEKNLARGAIALKAALDAEYRLVKDDKLLLTATKMKDAEMPSPLAMELATVELPGLFDEYDGPVTSAAISVLSPDISAILSKLALSSSRGKWQQLGLDIARQLVANGDDGPVAIDDWRKVCQDAGMVRQNQHRVLEALTNRGEIIVTNGAINILNN